MREPRTCRERCCPRGPLPIAGVAVLVFLVLPIFIVVPMSFSASRFLAFPPPAWSLRWYSEYFGSPEWMLATTVSLQAAAATCLLATPIGVAAAYAIHTTKDARSPSSPMRC